MTPPFVWFWLEDEAVKRQRPWAIERLSIAAALCDVTAKHRHFLPAVSRRERQAVRVFGPTCNEPALFWVRCVSRADAGPDFSGDDSRRFCFARRCVGVAHAERRLQRCCSDEAEDGRDGRHPEGVGQRGGVVFGGFRPRLIFTASVRPGLRAISWQIGRIVASATARTPVLAATVTGVLVSGSVAST